MNAPAVVRARKSGGGPCIEGASCLAGTERAPSRLVAAMTSLVCVAFTSIWGYVFISPDMPGLDPTIDFAWFVPTGPWFLAIWMAQTLCLAASFYLVLRTPPDTVARSPAIAVFVTQFILKSVWASLLFEQRAPVAGLCVMALFVICVVAGVCLAARVDRRAAFLMVPHLSWVAFVLLLTISTAISVGTAS
jgi:tryptophan-rich sensory protein